MRKIVFLWENFGPYHIDRLNAVAKYYDGQAHLIGIELSHKSAAYAWEKQEQVNFSRVTLTQDEKHFFERSHIWQVITLFRTVLKLGRGNFFFCHYEQPAIFLTAIFLRLLGRRVFIMNDMKHADFERKISREFIKAIFHSPYTGAIAAGRRSADYFRFLGIHPDRIHLGYGAVSLERLDSYLNSDNAKAYRERPFIVVARFMPMKNLFRILEAYNLYRQKSAAPRDLHLCGSGPLEANLRQYVTKLELHNHVHFRGFLQAGEITRAIAGSLCLILVSTQETFGNVIIEALALGIPVITSPICGATDEFVRSGVNGFLVEPENIAGLASYLTLMDSDEELWKRRSESCLKMRSSIDIRNFADAVSRLIEHKPVASKENLL